MGTACSKNPNKRKPKHGSRFEESQPQEATDDEIWTEETLTKHLDKLLKDMQQHSLKRMRDEVETDINTFILNNLLMCVQFFDNFEKSKEAGNQFRRKKESEINDKLAEGPPDGMILGERRCHLLNGMGHILAKNYIYRSPDSSVEEVYYGNYYYGSDPRNTFMCEGILPLEFTMTWDNLELYQNSEWDSLQAMNYSSAKGSPPILRFCMEEPDGKNNVQRGFLRLRSVDVTADVYHPTTESSYDYAYAGRFSDKVSEVASDSEEGGLSDFSGSDIDAEELMNNLMGSRNHLSSTTPTSSSSNPSSLERPKPVPLMDTFPTEKSKPVLSNEVMKKNFVDRLKDRRPSGVLPQNYPRLEKPTNSLPKLSTISEPNIPTVKINSSHTPPVTSNLPPTFPVGQVPPNSLRPPPHAMKSRLLRGLSRSTQILNGNSSSSGYETMDSAMSRSSSLASEEIRHKWRQVELKQLWQYPAKNRVKPDVEIERQDPLSSNCFIPIKFEVTTSDEEDSDSEYSDSSDDSDTPKEPRYDTRYYFNSTQLSSEYCSEFHYIGLKHGLPPSSVSQAVVLGTTVRCAIEYTPESQEEDNFHVTHTFTPSIHSKAWPSNYYFWFNQRMYSRKHISEVDDHWPNQDQVENIEKLGSNAVPLGFRSIEFFNTQQSLEWQLNFAQAETLLLNSFKNVHWRAYVFSSLIFRAFLAPLGPQGIGNEHIRNIMYFMCHEDFVGWNDEQPGVHLRAVLSKLYDCLAKGKMPHFFVQSQDLLKSIPPQNARLVQAHLSHLRDNLTVYCIYAFRNLSCVQQENKFYPMANFKKLYDIITAPQEKDLLRINNPGLGIGMSTFEEEVKPKKTTRKHKSDKFNLNLIENEDEIEGDFRTLIAVKPPTKPDKAQQRMKRKHILYQQQMREKAARDRELQRQKASPDAKIPTTERRKSIDLQQLPVIQEKFSTLRKVLVIEFFIKHFIKMATKSNEFRAYSQSAMYIMHVENLCDILLDPRYDLGQTTLDEVTIDEYKRQCGLLREVVGKEIREYVLARFSHLNLPTLTSHNIIGELSRNRGAFNNNWDFRKLPTPPGSHVDPSEFAKPKEPPRKLPQAQKKLETPNIVKSLQSIRPGSPIPSEISSAKLARRAESIKFIDTPVAMKRSTSRQSIIFTDEFESTDL